MSPHGYRYAYKDQPWPPHPNKINVFVFGNSTTIGFNVEDQHTVPGFLHKKLRAAGCDTEVYNFGCGSYHSRQEALRFLDLLDRGFVPQFAIFLDGLTDSFYALGNPGLLRTLDHLYQTEKTRRRLSYLGALFNYARAAWTDRRSPMPSVNNYKFTTDDPDLLKLASPEGIAEILSDTPAMRQSVALPTGQQNLARTVWQRYLDTVHMIDSLSMRYGVKTLFAWQPVPVFETWPQARVMERMFFAFPASSFCSAVYKWLAIEKFPDLPPGTNFLDLSRVGAGFQNKCYVDYCHYSAFFAEIIAARLAEVLAPVVSRNPRRT
jgi:hypothetical protein